MDIVLGNHQKLRFQSIKDLRRVLFNLQCLFNEDIIIMSHKTMPAYRLWGSTDDGAIEFRSMTTENIQGVLELLREAYFTDGNTCRGFDILSEPGATKELEEMCLDAARDGVSVVAHDVASRKIVGVVFNKIQKQPKSGEKSTVEILSDTCEYKSMKGVVDLMILMDSKVNLFEHFNVDCFLEVKVLATATSHRKRRIGELLVASSIEIATQLKHGKDVRTPVEVHGTDVITNANCVPGLVSAIMSSFYSQKLAEKLGFSAVTEVNFEDYVFDGKKVSERIDDVHKSWKLMAKRI